jgi:hypothetical protein
VRSFVENDCRVWLMPSGRYRIERRGVPTHFTSKTHQGRYRVMSYGTTLFRASSFSECMSFIQEREKEK